MYKRQADIRTTEDLSLHMKRITDLYEFADSKITLLAVDDSGKYYTEEGNQGMVRDTYHFEHSPKKINYVSNFMTTNESRMVFLKKLEPVSYTHLFLSITIFSFYSKIFFIISILCQ